MERTDEARREDSLYDRIGSLEREKTKLLEQIKGLEQENILLRIDLAEALEYCIGDDIEAATKSLEEALKRL